MTNFDNSVPIVNQPFLYINEMKISNDATTPNTVLNITAGICRDRTNSFDLNLGNYNGVIANQAANSVTSLNAAKVGINGIDGGTLATSQVYYVYCVSDVVSANPTGTILSLNSPSDGGPVMPFGYNASRHIGYAITDASTHILAMYNTGNNNARTLTFDAEQATAVTAGNVTTYTAVDLSKWVPAIANNFVSIGYVYTPAAASHTLKMQGAASTGDQVTVTSQVTSIALTGNVPVLAQIGSNKPEINYKVSNSGDAVALNVAGFNYYL